MRPAIVGVIVLAFLAVAAPASAGCFATVGLAPPPAGTAAGAVWTAEITVLHHGQNPLPDAADAKPTLTIVNTTTGARETFTATASDPAAGRYEASVVFPSAGSWRYEVFDGFTSMEGEAVPCAQTHTFNAVEIGSPGGTAGETPASGGGVGATSAATADGFPVWPLAGGVLGALLLAAVGVLYFRRRPGPAASVR
jgi:hypothetical protein